MKTDTTLAIAPVARPRGFLGLPCLRCGEQDQLTIRLEALEFSEAICCGACEAEYGVDDVQAAVEAWTRVLTWIGMSPELPE
jgi:transcription elongation factor Elf1